MRRPRSILGAAILASTSLASSFVHAEAPPVAAGSAPAAPAGDDELALKNGGMLRGTLVAVDPGKEAVIVLGGTGEARRVPWGEIEKVERAKYAKPAAATAPPTPPTVAVEKPSPPTPPPVPSAPEKPVDHKGEPRVHIDADKPGVVLRELEDDSATVNAYSTSYTRVSSVRCAAPCDRVIDGSDGERFFFAGDGIPASPMFRLGGWIGPLRADVKAGSSAMLVGGRILAIFGGGAIVAGVVTLGYDAANKGTGGGAPLPLIGGLMVGAGAAVAAGGIAMLVLGPTKYRLEGTVVGSLVRDGVIRF